MKLKLNKIILSAATIPTLTAGSILSATSCGCSTTNSINITQTSFDTDLQGIFTCNFKLNSSLSAGQTIDFEVAKTEGNTISYHGTPTITGTDVVIQFQLNIDDYTKEQNSSFKIKASCVTSQYTKWTKTIENLTVKYTPYSYKIVPNNYLDIRTTTYENDTLMGFKSGVTIPDEYDTLSIPESVQTINANAFEGKIPSTITNIYIPNSCVDIQDKAFANNTQISLVNIQSWATAPNWSGKEIFTNVAINGTLQLSVDHKQEILNELYYQFPGPWTFNMYYETYISNRTFSLMACNKTGDNAFGTAWIYKDATPKITTDYTYYVATNLHVSHAFDKISNYQLYFGDYSMASKFNIIDGKSIIAGSTGDYKTIYDLKPEVEAEFHYDNYFTDGQSAHPYYQASVDLALLKITFSSDGSSLPTKVKTKLDHLNTLPLKNVPIVDFAPSKAPDLTKQRATGGYPVKASTDKTVEGGKWECNKVLSNLITYNDWAATTKDWEHSVSYPDKDQSGNEISYKDPEIEAKKEAYYYWDVSPQIRYSHEMISTWMSGGASGSMLVNEDYQVEAIYWGGWTTTSSGNNYLPCFTQFNNIHQDFITTD